MVSNLRRKHDLEPVPVAAAGARHAALVLPAIVVVIAALVLTDLCCRLLVDSAQAVPAGLDQVTLSCVLGGFLLGSAGLVVVQASRVSSRFAGPERRLIEALRRMREGDLTFRVHLRRGDPLIGVARACNELLDWLNDNPPAGSRVGGDIIEVEPEPMEEVAP